MLEFFLVLNKTSQQKSHQYNPEIFFFQSTPRNQKRLQKLTSYRIFKMRYFCQILGKLRPTARMPAQDGATKTDSC